MCALNHHSIDWHWHDEVEWVFARTGNIECSIEADTIQLQTGDGAFINSRALHRFKSDADTLMPNILFSPDFIAAQDSPVFSDYMEPVIFSNRSFLVFRRNQEKDAGILTLLQDIFRKRSRTLRTGSAFKLPFCPCGKRFCMNMCLPLLENARKRNFF